LVALVDGVKRLLPFSRMLQSMGLSDIGTPGIVLCDNKSVLHIIANGEGFSGKSRHMRVRWNFVTELIEEGAIRTEHVDTNENRTDLFTKPMGGNKMRYLRSLVLNAEPDVDSVGENLEDDEDE